MAMSRCCRFLAQTIAASAALVDSKKNDGHVTDPTSPWCPVLGFVCFQLMESWMRFRGHGWGQLKWQGCDFSPCKGRVG